jgi:hypothetical protein
MRFTVLDALGRTVVAEQNLSAGAHVLPPGLAPGTYFIVLKSADGRAVLKWAVAE